MKIKSNIRLYTWLEFLIWFVILSVFIWGYKLYNYNVNKKFPSYQIFMPDADGLIVGSPVRYMGTKIGYVKNIKILNDNVYVRFVLTTKDINLPKGIIATVEFNGLGGSKSLEIYPPQEGVKTDKIILVKPTIRIRDAFVLFNAMYEKITSIGSRTTYFVHKISGVNNDEDIEINQANIGNSINDTDKFIDILFDRRKEFMQKLMKGNNNE